MTAQGVGGVREVFHRKIMLELRVEDRAQPGKEGRGGKGTPGRGGHLQRLRHEREMKGTGQ